MMFPGALSPGPPCLRKKEEEEEEEGGSSDLLLLLFLVVYLGGLVLVLWGEVEVDCWEWSFFSWVGGGRRSLGWA